MLIGAGVFQYLHTVITDANDDTITCLTNDKTTKARLSLANLSYNIADAQSNYSCYQCEDDYVLGGYNISGQGTVITTTFNLGTDDHQFLQFSFVWYAGASWDLNENFTLVMNTGYTWTAPGIHYERDSDCGGLFKSYCVNHDGWKYCATKYNNINLPVMAHNASSLTINWSCNTDSPAWDEWFGIRNVVITTYACYMPQCWKCSSKDAGATCWECRPGYILVG